MHSLLLLLIFIGSSSAFIINKNHWVSHGNNNVRVWSLNENDKEAEIIYSQYANSTQPYPSVVSCAEYLAIYLQGCSDLAHIGYGEDMPIVGVIEECPRMWIRPCRYYLKKCHDGNNLPYTYTRDISNDEVGMIKDTSDKEFIKAVNNLDRRVNVLHRNQINIIHNRSNMYNIYELRDQIINSINLVSVMTQSDRDYVDLIRNINLNLLKISMNHLDYKLHILRTSLSSPSIVP